MNDDLINLSNFKSITDFEKELMRKRSKLIYQLKDPVVYEGFMDFMSVSKSSTYVLILNLIFALLFFPTFARFIETDDENHWFLSFEVILMFIIFTTGWILYNVMREKSWIQRHGVALLRYSRCKSFPRLADNLQQVLYICTVSLKGLELIHRTWTGSCHKSTFLYSWTCNPDVDMGMFPMDTGFMLMVIPILFTCVMRENRLSISLGAWTIVLFSLCYSTYLVKATRPISIIILYVVISVVIILDSFKQYLLFYLLSSQLKKTIDMNQKFADQNKATEMRHMIANIAHDLKTPLSSFMTGIDIISADMVDFERRIKEPRESMPGDSYKDLSISFVASLQSCIANIRNTNAFMLMTINRCLDYTKASNGLKLVPKNETIDLAETLKMPLQCMTNIQQKIKICLMPYGEQGICSHVITDKQWLQENVLCLLSNAVKYSAGGEVVIKVTRLSRVEGAKLGEAVNRSLPTDKVCCKVEDEVITTDPDLGGRSPVSRFRSMRVGSLSGNWIREASRANLLAISDPSFISNLRLKISPKHNRVNPSNVGEEKTVNAFSPRRWRRSSSSASNEDRSVMSITPRWWKGSVANDNDSVQDRIDTKTEFGGDQSVAPNDLDTISEKSASEELMFEVIDTGIGISEEAMKTLFNPFKQTQRLAGGTGLGLYSLAKRIEAMSGKYGVHQRKDGKQGSVFWFTLPYKPDEVTAAHCTFIKEDTAISTKRFSNSESQPLQSEVNSSRVSNGHKFHLKPELSVLLAEDTPSIAKMTSMMLRRQHHQTAVAENGQIALDMLYKSDLESGIISEGRYDVVLMDLQMPVMDGLEATRRIRAHEREMGSKNKNYHHHQIVIGVSANSDHETMEEALKAGIDDFLPKPFSVDAFLTAVKNVQEKLSQQY